MTHTCILFVLWYICVLSEAVVLPISQHVLATNTLSHVRHELKKAEIVPTVIDEFLPSFFVNVSWSDANARLGNTIPPKALQEAPSVTLIDPSSQSPLGDNGLTYIVTLTDPDAPSRDDPRWSEMCHWIATGLRSRTVGESGFPMSPNPSRNGVSDIVPYKAPGPPKKTGKHRYVFIIFAPANGTSDQLHLSKPSDRQHWGTGKERHGVRDWAAKNGLVPVAANFVYSQHKKQ